MKASWWLLTGDPNQLDWLGSAPSLLRTNRALQIPNVAPVSLQRSVTWGEDDPSSPAWWIRTAESDFFVLRRFIKDAFPSRCQDLCCQDTKRPDVMFAWGKLVPAGPVWGQEAVIFTLILFAFCPAASPVVSLSPASLLTEEGEKGKLSHIPLLVSVQVSRLQVRPGSVCFCVVWLDSTSPLGSFIEPIFCLPFVM